MITIFKAYSVGGGLTRNAPLKADKTYNLCRSSSTYLPHRYVGTTWASHMAKQLIPTANFLLLQVERVGRGFES